MGDLTFIEGLALMMLLSGMIFAASYISLWFELLTIPLCLFGWWLGRRVR